MNGNINTWRMIYRLMDNVKTKMDLDLRDNEGVVKTKDINNIIRYIQNSLDKMLVYNYIPENKKLNSHE